MNNKLMFVLCYTCGLRYNKSECNHDDEKRALPGTWVIDEVLKAIEKGYQVIEIYEIWKFEIKQLNSNDGGLFGEFINKFLKMKQEANGFPLNCDTDQKRQAYIEDFQQHEGIKLERVSKNPGLRSLSKIMLNSFWGKFGQRENLPKTLIISDTYEFYKLLSDPTLTVTHITEINDETLIVNYEFKEGCIESSNIVNSCVAAYTTAQARIKLYSYLELLEQRALYYDTDSIIFISKDNLAEPSTGCFLGDLTDELAVSGPGSYISEFISAGPKSYAYKVFSPQTNKTLITCKVKGFTLNYKNSQNINFETMKKLVCGSNEDPILIIGNNISRTRDFNVLTTTQSKIFKPTSLKRVFFVDYSSIPYGNKRIRK